MNMRAGQLGLTRRGFLGLGAGVAAAVAVSGCTSEAATEGSVSSGSTSSETAAAAETLDEITAKLNFDAEAQPDPVKTVAFVSGSWYEMGAQFAGQATDALKRFVATGLAGAVADYGFEGARSLEETYLDYYEQQAPNLVELYEGMAAGLGLAYEDFMLGVISFVDDPETIAEEEDSSRSTEGCSTVAAWGEQTADGKLIVGADWDSNGEDCYYLPCVVAYPEDGYAFISESGFQGNLVLNDQGFVAAGSSGQSAGDGDMGVGIPVMTSQWLVAAEYASATEAAEAYLDRFTTTYGDNANYNDLNGGHIVVEATCAHSDTRTPGDFDEVDYLITTNDFMCEEMQSSILPEGSGYDDCRPRYYTEEKILVDAAGEADAATVADSIGCTGYYDPDSDVWVTDNWSYETGLNSPEAVSPFYQNVMKAIAVADDGAYYVMNGCSNTEVSLLPDAEGTYVQLYLDASPADVAADARSTANALIFSAGSHIDHLDVTADGADSLAERLTDELNESKEALVEGDNYTIKAELAEGDDALALYAKAASAYLRSQSAAQLAQEDVQAVFAV